MSRSMPSAGMLGSPTSDIPMIGHGLGLSWQNRWNEAASFSGRITRLPWTKPLATPAVVLAMPLRQACRATTLGDKFAVSSLVRSVLAKLVIVVPASILVDIYSRIWL